MHRCMKNPLRLQLRRYAARLIDLNEYLASVPRETMADNIYVTELNEILSKSISLSLFYCLPCSPSLIIIGWWSSNPGAYARESLVTEYRIVYGTRVLYKYTRFSLVLDSISLKFLKNIENCMF